MKSLVGASAIVKVESERVYSTAVQCLNLIDRFPEGRRI
jgi:hypothetical protein